MRNARIRLWKPASRIARAALAVALVGLPTASSAEDVARLRLADGVEMAYVDRGAGEPALVFVHCGNCRLEIWKETLDAFAPKNRVVAMDLPGHGRSTANRTAWSLEALGADVAALVEALKLRRVVLVGNSLGGPTALEAARRLGPARVLGVIAVDTLHDVEFQWPKQDFEQTLAAYRRDFATTCDRAMLRLLPEAAPQAARDRIARETCDDDPAAFTALFATLLGYDQAAALRGAGVPVRAINGDGFATAVETNRKYEPSFEAVVLKGVGHYPQVEQPAAFQRELRRFVDALAAPR